MKEMFPMHVEVNDNSNVTDRLIEIERILLEVQRRIPDIEGIAVVTRDGLPIASLLHSDNDEDQISAMTAASLSLSERVVIELKRGIMEQVIITGSDGLIVIRNAGEYAVLVAIVRINTKLGLVLFDMKRAADKLSGMI
jgi:predicted regulator of Ras-like GTPase activity (Roadblock/LC7/MglB family)